MTTRADDLLKLYLSLPEDEKWAVASHILDDLHGPSEAGAEQAWNVEIDRRVDEFDRGGVKTVPWESVDAKMTQLLNAKKR